MCNIWVILAAFASYLVGAIPFGYIITKILRRVDIRTLGSHNPGATNVYRSVGPVPGVITLVLDIAKGIVPVIVFGDLALSTEPCMSLVLVRLIIAVAAVCGHNWTVFLGFRGGKGMATSAGVLIGLSVKIPTLGMIVGLCLGCWIIVFFLSGYVSLASIAAAILLPIFMAVFSQPVELVVFAVALCLFAVYRHKSNDGRLLRGQERRMFKKP